ncbi:uncharacterized protein N7487_001677 [Penicillium crustosum]|uniref:uncharacterized protein n=1 Tax=Penicillium crustosum TaxID=36656 RepID=UPI0023964589|nr:uncharacterized protein N7487_001677 [Penicillium crustosum]KAJ5418127.1 hypothetical protein N7487_001677 [Penicillium crustosum]
METQGSRTVNRRSQKWLPFARRVTEGERGWGPLAAAARMDIGRSMGPGTRHGQPETQVAVNESRVGFGPRDAKTDHGERAA